MTENEEIAINKIICSVFFCVFIIMYLKMHLLDVLCSHFWSHTHIYIYVYIYTPMTTSEYIPSIGFICLVIHYF